MHGEALGFKPGTAFKSGKMYIFTKGSVTVIKPWPPAAWRKTKTKPWMRCRPRADLLLTDLPGKEWSLIQNLAQNTPGLLRDVEQGQTFFPWYGFPRELSLLRHVQQLQRQHRECFAAVPARVLELVQRFEERRFALMSFAHACGDFGLELLESNAALGFMVATNWIWHKPYVKRPQDAARRLVRMRRRDILQWLQFSIPSDGAARALAKYPAELLSVESLFYLRDGMRHPEVLRLLSDVPNINRGIIRIAGSNHLWPHTTPSLLREVAENIDDAISAQTAYFLHENLQMMRRLERDFRTLRFVTIKRVHEMHRQLSHESERIVASTKEFPSPPIPGIEGIEPIETPEQLIREAEEQHNCVMSLALEIVFGRMFLYRMLKPERATISVLPRGDVWVMQECRGPNNASVAADSMTVVKRWLALSQKGTKGLP